MSGALVMLVTLVMHIWYANVDCCCCRWLLLIVVVVVVEKDKSCVQTKTCQAYGEIGQDRMKNT